MTGTTNYHWSSPLDCVMHETNGSGSVQAVYTNQQHMFGPLLAENRSGTQYYHHYDAPGSTMFLTNAIGTVTDTFLYDAWGNAIARSGNTATPYQWIGQWGYQSVTQVCYKMG